MFCDVARLSGSSPQSHLEMLCLSSVCHIDQPVGLLLLYALPHARHVGGVVGEASIRLDNGQWNVCPLSKHYLQHFPGEQLRACAL